MINTKKQIALDLLSTKLSVVSHQQLNNIIGGNQNCEMEEMFNPAIGLAIHAIRMKRDNGGDLNEIF